MMPTYKVTDPMSGKTVRLTGDSEPTEQELSEVFASLQNSPSPPPAEAPGQNILSRLNESLVKRGVNIAGTLQPHPGGESLYQTMRAAPGRSLRMTGQAAGFGNDIIGEGVRAGFDALPDFPAVKSMATDLYQSTFLPGALQAGMQGYGKAKEMFPEGMENVEAVGNIIGLGTMGAGGRAVMPAVREGGNIVRDLSARTVGKTAAAVIPENYPSNLVQTAAKWKTTLAPEESKRLSGILLKEKIPLSPDGYAKLDSTIDTINESIKTGLKPYSNTPIDAKAVVSRVDEAIKKAERSYDPKSELSKISTETERFLENWDGKLSVEMAQAIKQDIYKQLRRHYDSLGKGGSGLYTDGEIAAKKNIARGLKEEIETTVPDLPIKQLNARESELLTLEPHLRRAVGRIGNHNILSIDDVLTASAGSAILGPVGGAAAGVAKHVLGRPSVKSRIAMSLDEMQKPPAPLRSNTMQMAQEMARQRQGPPTARPSYGPQDLSLSGTGRLTVAPPGLDIDTPAYLRNRLALPPGQGFEFGSGYLPSTITDLNFIKPATNLESLAQDFLSSQRQGGLSERLTANARNVMNARDAQILDNFDQMISDFVKRGKGRGIGNQP